MTSEGEMAILSRIIQPEQPELPSALARQILQWEFPEEDRTRMHALLEKAKEGSLEHEEKAQAESYERIGHFLSLLKSKARVSLKAKNGSTR